MLLFIDKFLSEGQSSGRPVKIYYNFNEAVEDFKPNAVFITNPNSKHLETALLAAKSGQNLFIEKPLAHHRNGLDELKELAKKKKLKIMIGYNLRWHPLLKKMKLMVTNGDIGQPISANIEMGKILKTGIRGKIIVRLMPRIKMAAAELYCVSVMILIIFTGFSECLKRFIQSAGR